MRSLYDVLHLENPETPDAKPPTPEPTPVTKRTIKARAREVLESPQYLQSLLSRIMFKDLPPQVEVLLYHYAYGKPPDRVEIEDVTLRVENATPEQLEERALMLAKAARAMRENAQSSEPDVQTGVTH